MLQKKRSSQIPPPGVVRFIGAILLGVDLTVLVLAVLYIEQLGTTTSVLIIAGTLGTLYFPIKAIKTGNPEWVLLDVIFSA